MPNTLNGRRVTKQQEAQEKSLNLTYSAPNLVKDDWSYATKELLDLLPQVWTRGLLYFLVIFVSIALPWAILSQVDETGTARGRLEPKSKTFRLDAPVAGTVTAIKVKQGDKIAAQQSLLEIESESVRSQLQQQQQKLQGQKQRLSQLELLENQLKLALTTQQQQNKAQELEKKAQVEQAKQNFEFLQKAYNLQKEEQIAQVNQAKQDFAHSQKAYDVADNRLARAQTLVKRYQETWQQGVVAEIEVIAQEDLVDERQQLQQQAKSEVEQTRLRLEEQTNSYQRKLKQAEEEIEQAKLRIEEQEGSYQSLIRSGELSLLKIQEQLQDLAGQITNNQAEIAQSQSQIDSLQFQLAQRILEAPVQGVVFNLPLQGEGVVVQPGDIVAEIAPEGSDLILRAQMATKESGSLQEGMAVKLKFDAYPFQDYGVVAGKLKQISPTSKVQETEQGKVAAYELEIELEQNCIPTPSKCIALRPGDTATAEVVIRQRRIIDFILDPFKKLQQGGLQL